MKKSILIVLAAILIILIPGCNKSSENYGTGRMTIKITDAPFPIEKIESAWVTITKVEMRKAGDGIPDGNPFITITEDTTVFDLIDLRNGVTADLADDIEIPAGKYNLVRLYVNEAGLVTKDGVSHKVKVPSGGQTGIKIFIRPEITVEGGLTSELLIDFDLSRSFILRGNPDKPAGINGFIFKPVIRAVNNTTTGRIEGVVTDTVNAPINEAEIWLEQDTIVSTTFSDASGHYAFLGVPAGTYSLSAVKENYDTLTYSGIKVTEGNRTIRDFILKIK
ncbi:MAG TPA: DUF4382 domain-containing protein [Bacteroidales bacterium]|jgi:hypothetical protein|nr:MAG: hypothetical protein BWX96_01179 [Bacteroidetes bacterium ADurb.Bin145]HOU01581.1 DUF4382 domain-containing protein [Bacteroidales bacterium]